MRLVLMMSGTDQNSDDDAGDCKTRMLITLMTLVLMLVTKISPGTPPSFSHGRQDSIAESR